MPYLRVDSARTLFRLRKQVQQLCPVSKTAGWPLLNGLPNLPRIRNQTQASKNQQLCFQPYRGCNIQRNVLINARLQNQKAAGLPFLLMQTEAEHQFEHSTC